MIPAAAEITAPIAIHYHHGWLIFGLFFLGLALHALLQLDDIARKNSATKRAVLLTVWVPMLYRAAAATVIFGLIWQHPELIVKAVNLLGVNISPDEASVLAIPMNNVLALGYGLCFDSLLGYIPFFKSQLPPVEVSNPNQRKG